MITRCTLGVLVAAAGCGSIPAGFTELPGRTPEREIEMQYLGCGGWLISRGGDLLATAPHVSNPTGFALLFGGEPDGPLIEKVVPPMSGAWCVLVGHAHYDHAMDLPYLARFRAPRTVFCGGRTAVNVLVAGIERRRLLELRERDLATRDHRGQWFYNARMTMRFMALRSTHAPHIFGIKLAASGSVAKPRKRLPGSPLCWPEGETLAFLIDFLGSDGAVEFRIYYQDAASEPGSGVPPPLEGPDAAPIDVAILCAAAFDQVDDNPEHLLRAAQPRHVIAGHWEDFFFRAYEDPLVPVVGTDLGELLRRVHAVRRVPVYLPAPRESLHFAARAAAPAPSTD